MDEKLEEIKRGIRNVFLLKYLKDDYDGVHMYPVWKGKNVCYMVDGLKDGSRSKIPSPGNDLALIIIKEFSESVGLQIDSEGFKEGGETFFYRFKSGGEEIGRLYFGVRSSPRVPDYPEAVLRGLEFEGDLDSFLAGYSPVLESR